VPTTDSFARLVRLRRLFTRDDGRLLVVPLDHSVTDGPVVSGGHLDDLIGQVAMNGADAVVLHKGSLRHLDPSWFQRLSLIVHLSVSTARAPEPDAKYLVASVDEALRLGADGVSVHVNVGSRHEREQIADLAAVAGACDRWQLPLLAMMYPRGPGIADPYDPELVAHAVTVAVELGADIVKTVFPRSVAALADITRACPVPVLIAGGSPTGDPFARVLDALAGGAAGVAMGRHIFRASDPAGLTSKIADLVHSG
jgi:2-amino-4,5-dihydroxy-6-oxo-7-(phosphonooxy)heptanoate synthase